MIDLSKLVVGKREQPRPENWVLDIFGEGEDGLEIQHVAHFGAGEQAQKFAEAICRACNMHDELVAVIEGLLDEWDIEKTDSGWVCRWCNCKYSEPKQYCTHEHCQAFIARTLLKEAQQEETVELPVAEPEKDVSPRTKHYNIITRFDSEARQVMGKMVNEITAYASELFSEKEALEEQLDKLAKKILSYDCGLPCANKEHPDGMGAVEAVMLYMDQLRKELGLMVGD